MHHWLQTTEGSEHTNKRRGLFSNYFIKYHAQKTVITHVAV